MASCAIKPLTVGSLFSGIGGLDLGLERAGMRVIWQSEIDPYACKVLAKHWPEVPNLGDIKRINFADVVRPDVICGGYPCQPFSTAGKRQGEEDPRHLWPWVREAIRVLRPRYAILENVRGHLSLGGTTVLSEIAALGYSAEWRVVSAASVGANHRRDRVIIVAYPNGSHAANGGQRSVVSSQDRSGRNDGRGGDSDPREVALRSAGQDSRYVADGESIGGDGRESRHGQGESGAPGATWVETGGIRSHVANTDDARGRASRRDPEREGASSVERRQELAQSQPGRRGADVADTAEQRQQEWRCSAPREVFAGNAWRRISDLGSVADWWETEPDVGRVANGIPNRVDRLKGLGNAVVPQVAEVIGRLVVAHAGT